MQRRNGFTIIEVLIVLAIVGLIMLVVFLAVPALQRNARNVQRRADVGILRAEVQERRTLNQNSFPTSCNNTQAWCYLRNLKTIYYDNQSLTTNNVSFWNRTAIGPFEDGVDLQLNPNTESERVSMRSYAKCNGNQLTGVDARPGDLATQFVIETASGPLLQCLEG